MRGRDLIAEFIGTFAVVLALLGGLVLAPTAMAGLAGALGAGLMMIAAMAALGPVSGAHLNPAVTIGLVAAGRLDSDKAPAYILAQCLGALAAAGLLALVVTGGNVQGRPGLAAIANGYGRSHSMPAVLLLELAGSFVLVLLVLGMGARRAAPAQAPLAIGAATIALYLVTIPVSGGGLNPARSLAGALFNGVDPLLQLWAFWVAPILGAVAAGVLGRAIFDD